MGLNQSFSLVVPELVLTMSGLLLLLLSAWRRNWGQLLTGLAIFALLLAGVAIANLWQSAGTRGVGGDYAFDGLFVADSYVIFSKLLIYTAAILTLLITPNFMKRRGAMIGEYPILVLFAVCGMSIMVSATDLLTLYIGLELNSLAAYVLASFVRNDMRSAEAGLKYFVLGALASGILLFGMSLIYGFSGSTNLAAIGAAFTGELGMGATFGIVFVLSGLAFKISAAPFHMWTPDVYEGAPTPVTAFFASAPKVAATVLMVRLVIEAFGNQVFAWQQIIIAISLLSIIVGAIGAIGQTNLKRLLAYSSINNVGFILIGLAANSQAGVAALLTYLTIYIPMTIGSFAVLMQLRNRAGEQLENMSDIAGLSSTRPALAFAMLIFMFSLAGVPPMFGFWGKLVVFNAAVESGLLPLAVIGIAASVIGAFYYLKIVKLMYFDEPRDIVIACKDRGLRWVTMVMALLVSPLAYALILWLTPSVERAAGALF